MVSAHAFNGPIIHYPFLLLLLLASPRLVLGRPCQLLLHCTGNSVYLLLFIAKIHLFHPQTSPAEEMVYKEYIYIIC